MAVDVPGSFQNLDQSIQLEIATLSTLPLGVYLITLAPVLACCLEAILDEGFDSHACLGIACRKALAPVGLLDVLSQRELDPWFGACKVQACGLRSPAQLDDFHLASDRVGRSMEQIADREATSQLSIEVHGGGIYDIFDADLGRACLCSLVDATANRCMGVGIDEAGGQVLAPNVQDEAIAHRPLQALADGVDLALLDQHVTALQLACCSTGPDRRSLHEDPLGLGGHALFSTKGPEWEEQWDLALFPRALLRILSGGEVADPLGGEAPSTAIDAMGCAPHLPVFPEGREAPGLRLARSGSARGQPLALEREEQALIVKPKLSKLALLVTLDEMAAESPLAESLSK